MQIISQIDTKLKDMGEANDNSSLNSRENVFYGDECPYLPRELESLDTDSKIEPTCIAVSSSYFITGTSHGSIFLFNRLINQQVLPMCKKPPEAITAMQLHSSEQSELLAIGHAMGRLIILSLPTSNGSRKMLQHQSEEHLRNPIMHICWSDDGSKILSCDISGVLLVTHVDFRSKCFPTIYIEKFNDPLIGMTTEKNFHVCLTATICKVYDMDRNFEIILEVDITPFETKLRGAYTLGNELMLLTENNAVFSHKIGSTSSLKFLQNLNENQSEYFIYNGSIQSPHYITWANEYFDGAKMVSFSNGVAIFSPNHVLLMRSNHTTTFNLKEIFGLSDSHYKIIDLAVNQHGDELFILSHLGDQLADSITDRPYPTAITKLRRRIFRLSNHQSTQPSEELPPRKPHLLNYLKFSSGLINIFPNISKLKEVYGEEMFNQELIERLNVDLDTFLLGNSKSKNKNDDCKREAQNANSQNIDGNDQSSESLSGYLPALQNLRLNYEQKYRSRFLSGIDNIVKNINQSNLMRKDFGPSDQVIGSSVSHISFDDEVEQRVQNTDDFNPQFITESNSETQENEIAIQRKKLMLKRIKKKSIENTACDMNYFTNTETNNFDRTIETDYSFEATVHEILDVVTKKSQDSSDEDRLMSSSTVSSTFQPYSGKTIPSSYQRFQHQSGINDQLDKSPVKLENHQDNFFNKPKSLTKSEENGHYLNEPYADEVNAASNYIGRSNEDEFYEDNAINSSKKVDSQDYEKDYDIGSDHMTQSASSALKEGEMEDHSHLFIPPTTVSYTSINRIMNHKTNKWTCLFSPFYIADLDVSASHIVICPRFSRFVSSILHPHFQNILGLRKKIRGDERVATITDANLWIPLKTTASSIALNESANLLWIIKDGVGYSFSSVKNRNKTALENLQTNSCQKEKQTNIDFEGHLISVSLTSKHAWYLTNKGVFVQMHLPEMGIRYRADEYPHKLIELTASDYAVWALRSSNKSIVARIGIRDGCPMGEQWEEDRFYGEKLVSIALSGHTGFVLDSTGTLWLISNVSELLPFGSGCRFKITPSFSPIVNPTVRLSSIHEWRLKANSSGIFINVGRAILFSHEPLTGHRFVHVVPEKFTVHDKFVSITAGSFTGAHDSKIYVCQPNSEIFAFSFAGAQNFVSLPLIFKSLQSSIIQISASENVVFALNDCGLVFMYKDKFYAGNSCWTQLYVGNDESTKVLSICSSKTSTWVICSDNRIFASRAGHTHSTERIFEWVEVTPPNQAEHELIDQVRISPNGKLVWIFSSSSGICWARDGITENNSYGRVWLKVQYYCIRKT